MQTLLSEDSMSEIFDEGLQGPKRELSASYVAEREKNLVTFENWTEPDQVDFIEHLLLRMCHYQHGQINEFLTPMLQRDFITLLPSMTSQIRVEKNTKTNIYIHAKITFLFAYFRERVGSCCRVYFVIFGRQVIMLCRNGL